MKNWGMDKKDCKNTTTRGNDINEPRSKSPGLIITRSTESNNPNKKQMRKKQLLLPPQDRRRGSMKKSSAKRKNMLQTKNSNLSGSSSVSSSRLHFFDDQQSFFNIRRKSSSSSHSATSSKDKSSSPSSLNPAPLTVYQLNQKISLLYQSIKERNWKDVLQSLESIQSLDCIDHDTLSKNIKNINGENLLTLGITYKAPLHILEQMLDTLCPKTTTTTTTTATATATATATTSSSTINDNAKKKKEIIIAQDEEYGDTCLHIACTNGTSIHIINWLLSIGHKQATLQKNKFGFTPLHQACASGASYEIIEKIIEVSCRCGNGGISDIDGYDIVTDVNHNNQTPLHLACSRSNASLFIIKKLIQLGKGREYVRMEGNDGRNALHLSYMNGAPMDVVMYILKIGGKDMLLDTNKQALNHLQLACMNGASNDIIKRFVQIGGKELVLEHFNDWENPLLLACTNSEVTLDIFEEFVAVGGEDVIHGHSKHGENVLHLLFSNESVSVDVVRYLGRIGGPELVTTRSKDGYNVLHLACMNFGRNVELFQVLLEIGGKELVLQKATSYGYNALHILTRNDPSIETVKYLLEAGGNDILIAEDYRGNNSLHCACDCLNANLIDVFVERSNLEVLSAVNFNKETPLDILLRKKDRVSLDKVQSIQTKWFELDTCSNTVPTITNANLLSWARQLDDIELTTALDFGLLKSIMNKNFIRPINIALLMTDLYIQIAIAIVYSFLIHPTITGEASSEVPRTILLICFCWSAFREFIEVFRAKSLYLLESANYADLLQLVLIMWTILLFDGGGVNQTERIVYTLATGVSCLELLIDFGNLSYPIAVFIIALIRIFWILIPFLVSTFLIVLSFAHMFYMWSISSSDTCRTDRSDTPEQKLHWTCNLSSSYSQTFSILITSNWSFLDEEAEGFQTSISYAFAFIVGILLLNILIAVINNAFSTIERSGDLEYWRYRLSFEHETQLLYSIGVTFVRPLNQAVRDSSCLLFHGNDEPTSSNKANIDEGTRPSNRPKLSIESRTTSIRDYFFTESFRDDDSTHRTFRRIRFDTFSLKEFDELKELDRNLFFKWWYDYPVGVGIPPLNYRLWYYFTRASWDEVIYPGQSFENVLIGVKFHEDVSGVRFILARILSSVIFLFNTIILVGLFIMGLMTFGLCWPVKMKERLFFGPLAPNQKNESIRLKAELECKIRTVQDEVSEVKNSLKNISSKQDELLKTLVANQAQIAELVVLLRNEKPH